MNDLQKIVSDEYDKRIKIVQTELIKMSGNASFSDMDLKLAALIRLKREKNVKISNLKGVE